ncbi:hypothetical protein KPH14_001335 [Odynerus spinipes]|uniref:Uncharacterized protein n=1 Tax=Odynerus spinipes TaxID=1348599 RepID=A0AAD9VK66_9HYME|nr:hypothetical protein KPH14_001335 [Odynerus spinipes]
MWCNMKGTQRDNLTREKQSRLATGGGPEVPAAEVDPDIAEITPNLMTIAPIIFSSNMSNEALKEGCKESQLATEPPSADDNFQIPYAKEKPSTSQLSQRKRLRENIAIASRKKNNNAVTDEENVEEKALKLKRIHCIIKQEE